MCQEPLRAGEAFCPACGFALVPDVSVGVVGVAISGGVAAAPLSYPDATLEFHLWEVLTGRPITLGPRQLRRSGILLLILLYVCWFGFGLLAGGCLWWAISGDEAPLNWIFGFVDLWTLWFGWRLLQATVHRQGQTGTFLRGVFQCFASIVLLAGVGMFLMVLLPVMSWHLPVSRAWVDAVLSGAVSITAYPCIKVWLS